MAMHKQTYLTSANAQARGGMTSTGVPAPSAFPAVAPPMISLAVAAPNHLLLVKPVGVSARSPRISVPRRTVAVLGPRRRGGPSTLPPSPDCVGEAALVF